MQIHHPREFLVPRARERFRHRVGDVVGGGNVLEGDGALLMLMMGVAMLHVYVLRLCLHDTGLDQLQSALVVRPDDGR